MVVLRIKVLIVMVVIMRNKVRNILKSSSLIYNLYFYIISFGLKIVGLFVKTDSNLVLFVSYSGRKYDDSP